MLAGSFLIKRARSHSRSAIINWQRKWIWTNQWLALRGHFSSSYTHHIEKEKYKKEILSISGQLLPFQSLRVPLSNRNVAFPHVLHNFPSTDQWCARVNAKTFEHYIREWCPQKASSMAINKDCPRHHFVCVCVWSYMWNMILTLTASVCHPSFILVRCFIADLWSRLICTRHRHQSTGQQDLFPWPYNKKCTISTLVPYLPFLSLYKCMCA